MRKAACLLMIGVVAVLFVDGVAGQIPRVGLEERVSSLEKTVEALKYRIVKLESSSKPNFSVASTKVVWRKLMHGQTPDQVRSLLGEPVSVEAHPGYTYWRYLDGNDAPYVMFYSATMEVKGWTEPK